MNCVNVNFHSPSYELNENAIKSLAIDTIQPATDVAFPVVPTSMTLNSKIGVFSEIFR